MNRTTSDAGVLRGHCRCTGVPGPPAATHVFGITGCRNEARAAAELAAEQDDDTPIGYAPAALRRR